MENIESSAPAATPSPSARAMMAPLVSMTLVQVIVCMAGFAVPVYAVPMARDLGVAPGAVGFYMSAVFSTAMVSAIICGQGVRRFGAIRMVQMALIAAALAQGAFAAGSLPLAVLAALIMGMAYGPPTPSSSYILARTTPPRLMPLVFSIKQTGVPAGAALAGAVVPALVLIWGWRGAALSIAALCLAAVVLIQPLRARLDSDRDPGARFQGGVFGPLRLVLGTSVLRRLAFMSFSFTAVQMALIAYLVTYLVEVIGFGLVEAGLVLASCNLAGVAGRIFWGAISGTVIDARRLLIALGVAMTGSCLVLVLSAPGWPLALFHATAILFGATAIGWNGVMLAELARVAPPGQAGAATGGFVFVTFGGIVAAPGLFGLLLDFGAGYSGGFLMLAAFAVLGTAMLVGQRQAPAGSRA
ncbi:MAG: MFS transporter [Alphaproteobacteria bacterium]|nr:MFS transporter [Alphaproteobacteria bacterium]